MNRGPTSLVLILLFSTGLLFAGDGIWIWSKARLAQYLLNQAWESTLQGNHAVKHWRWADTWPIARLQVPNLNVDLIVLAGDSGRNLAFGPAHASESTFPGRPGTVMISGHRDTYFGFLADLRIGSVIMLETPTEISVYRVMASQIVDAGRARIRNDPDSDRLVLVTCYPFDAITTGGGVALYRRCGKAKIGRRIDALARLPVNKQLGFWRD